VKELVLASMLLSARGVYEGHKHMAKMWLEETDNEVVKKRVEKEKKFFRGYELRGKTLAVVGLGHIGRLVAQSADKLGMKIVGFDPAISVDTAWQLPRTVKRAESMEELLKEADYLTLHAPYIKDVTHHMISEDELALMKPTCNILNFARGELVDSMALKARYEAGTHTGKYIADFAMPELHDQGYPVIEVPHLGASTEEAESNSATMGAKQITNFLEFGIIKNSVNFPECVPPPQSVGADGNPITRMSVVNKNVKGVLAELTTIFGEHKCNIVQHINTSRGDIAYNVIDMAGFPENPKELQIALSKVEGILSSRLLVGDPGTYFHVADGQVFA